MQLEEHTVKSSAGDYSRKVWILEAPNADPRKFGIFLDGEYYLHKMDAPTILSDLQAHGSIPPMTAVFVSHVDGAARHHDLTCNAAYSEFIAVDLVRWLRRRNEAMPEHGHLIAGPSLGGLAAAYLALAHPLAFSHCLSQSGSFWWRNERLKDRLDQMPASRGKFWISVGDQETQAGISHPPSGMLQEIAQLPACERFAEALRGRGHCVHYSQHAGGHAFEPWKDELPAALAWLLGEDAA